MQRTAEEFLLSLFTPVANLMPKAKEADELHRETGSNHNNNPSETDKVVLMEHAEKQQKEELLQEEKQPVAFHGESKENNTFGSEQSSVPDTVPEHGEDRKAKDEKREEEDKSKEEAAK